jgi:hypothetical protein
MNEHNFTYNKQYAVDYCCSYYCLAPLSLSVIFLTVVAMCILRVRSAIEGLSVCRPSARSQQTSGRAARLLRSWVGIPPGAWIFVCCECRVLSGRSLCDELITRPEEPYRLCRVVVCDLETSRIGAPYIYDISRQRVNNLTLILLTCRKW